jgi:hypothetical protein
MNDVSLTSTEVWPADAMPKHWIESLFEKMVFEYGKKFTDQWGGADPEGLKLYWAQRIAELDNDELRRGVAALNTKDWPPTLPEFIKLCKPSVEPMVAYYEAVNGIQARDKGEMGAWSHPAIYWASARMAFDLKSMTYSQIKDRWNKSLHDEMEKGEWPAIPEPMLALPEPGKSGLSREKAAQMLTELGASEVLKPKTDHRLWAKRILERAKKPGNDLSAIQIRFAKEAMAAKAA